MPISPTPTNNDELKRKEDIEWNDSLEDLLCEEGEKCKGLAWMHADAEKIFRGKNNWIQIPMIIFSTMAGSFQVGLQIDSRISQALGIISFGVSLLGMINSHFHYAQRAEAHKIASVQYAQIHKLIYIEMSLSRTQRTPPKYLLKIIRDDLKEFMKNFPRIPDKTLKNYEQFVVNKSEPNVKHPDIINGIEKIVPYDKFISKETITPSSSSFETPQETSSSFEI